MSFEIKFCNFNQFNHISIKMNTLMEFAIKFAIWKVDALYTFMNSMISQPYVN